MSECLQDLWSNLCKIASQLFVVYECWDGSLLAKRNRIKLNVLQKLYCLQSINKLDSHLCSYLLFLQDFQVKFEVVYLG